jgi:hypothetical protein
LGHPQWRLQNSLFNFFAPSTSLCYSNRMQNRENEVSKVARGASGGVNPECWVDDHGDCLYRYALLRVRHPEVAEDLVQETLCAAVRVYQGFRGSSSERSWLCGILKNKICDHFRKLGRETNFKPRIIRGFSVRIWRETRLTLDADLNFCAQFAVRCHSEHCVQYSCCGLPLRNCCA